MGKLQSVLKSIDIGKLEGLPPVSLFSITTNYRMIPLETFSDLDQSRADFTSSIWVEVDSF